LRATDPLTASRLWSVVCWRITSAPPGFRCDHEPWPPIPTS